MDNSNESLQKKIDKKIPENIQKIDMILTLLGIAGCLTDFVVTNNPINKLPDMVRYVCALTAGNMLALLSDEEKIRFKNLDSKEFGLGEQTQEVIYRKMKFVIETLYHQLQEDEKVLNGQ